MRFSFLALRARIYPSSLLGGLCVKTSFRFPTLSRGGQTTGTGGGGGVDDDDVCGDRAAKQWHRKD